MHLFSAKSAALLMVGLLAGCVSSGSNVGRVGQVADATVAGTVRVEGLNFPLPDGQWNEVQTYTVPGTSPRAPQTFTVYASVNDGVIDRAAVFWVQYKTTHQERWRRYQGCLDDSDAGVLHAVITRNTGSEEPSEGTAIDCWHIRSFSLGRSGSAHPTIEALQLFADREGLYLPVTMLSVRFAQKREVDRRDYADYLYNPDVLLPRPGGGPWRPEEWSAEAVAAEPAQAIVIDRLRAWAETWRPRLL